MSDCAENLIQAVLMHGASFYKQFFSSYYFFPWVKNVQVYGQKLETNGS